MADLHSPEWLEQANREITSKDCPSCGHKLASIGWELIATRGLLSGSQLKASVAEMLIAHCSNCEVAIKVTEE